MIRNMISVRLRISNMYVGSNVLLKLQVKSEMYVKFHIKCTVLCAWSRYLFIFHSYIL